MGRGQGGQVGADLGVGRVVQRLGGIGGREALGGLLGPEGLDGPAALLLQVGLAGEGVAGRTQGRGLLRGDPRHEQQATGGRVRAQLLPVEGGDGHRR